MLLPIDISTCGHWLSLTVTHEKADGSGYPRVLKAEQIR